jgi:hypothetical protein
MMTDQIDFKMEANGVTPIPADCQLCIASATWLSVTENTLTANEEDRLEFRKVFASGSKWPVLSDEAIGGCCSHG